MYKQQSRKTLWREIEGKTSPFLERQEGVAERVLASVPDTLKFENIQILTLPLTMKPSALSNFCKSHLSTSAGGNC